MGKELFKLVIGLVLLMIVMRLIFSEFDGRTAINRMNLAYFLNFEKKFTYNRTKSTLITIIICFLLFSRINIMSIEGLLILGLFVGIGMISDVLSSYVYHLYGRWRYKSKIAEAKAYVASLKLRILEFVSEDDYYLVNPQYDLHEVAERYILDDDHLVCFSNDGGEWFSKMPRYSQVSFVVDGKVEEAKKRFEDTPVRVTSLTKDGRYPFKDEKMDVIVCYNENYLPNEANRILKDGGTVILDQMGSENLIELYAFTSPVLFRNQWNLSILREGLNKQNYQILDSFEERGEIRFRTIAAFYQYVKEKTMVKMDQVEDYINQYFYIDQFIQKNGFFAMKTHRFYAVARKGNV